MQRKADLGRDIDLIEDILIKIGGGQTMFQALASDADSALHTSLETPMSQGEADKLENHLEWLAEQNYIESWWSTAKCCHITRFTLDGQEFLKRIRNR
jgi:hypothetical protein